MLWKTDTADCGSGTGDAERGDRRLFVTDALDTGVRGGPDPEAIKVLIEL